MASNRIGRINEEIQRELSSLFRTLKDPRVQGGMVTITHVDTTTDLRYCRVFVSVLDKTQEKDVIRGLKSAAGYLRRELGMAMSLRYTPELLFTPPPQPARRRGLPPSRRQGSRGTRSRRPRGVRRRRGRRRPSSR